MGKIGSGTDGSKVMWDNAHWVFKGLNAARHPSECLKSKMLATPMLIKTWSNRSSHLFLVGTASGTATLKDSLPFLIK